MNENCQNVNEDENQSSILNFPYKYPSQHHSDSFFEDQSLEFQKKHQFKEKSKTSEDPLAAKEQDSDLKQSSNSSFLAQNEKKKKVSKKKCQSKRSSNYMTSNIVRGVKQCLKNMLKSQNRDIYDDIMSFIQSQKIKGQIWGFIGILMYMLYLRDIKKTFPQIKYLSTINLISSKLNQQRQKQQKNKQSIKNPLDTYIEYLKTYKEEHRSYSNVSEDKDRLIQEFLEKVIAKRQPVINDCRKNLQSIKQILDQESVLNLDGSMEKEGM